MVDELRIYTLRPGAMARYLELAETVAVPIRGDRHGVLLGFWGGEVGAANTVFNLWRHESLETRKQVRATLETLPDWRARYLAAVRPLMLRQVVRFMDEVVPLGRASSGLYEMRLIRCVAGSAGELSRAMAEEPEAGQIGLWLTTAGPINEVVQLLAIDDARARFARSWHEGGALAKWGKWVEEAESSLMLAAPHSPLG
jgi:hypothetical protein